jgi:hypothetical protein
VIKNGDVIEALLKEVKKEMKTTKANARSVPVLRVNFEAVFRSIKLIIAFWIDVTPPYSHIYFTPG